MLLRGQPCRTVLARALQQSHSYRAAAVASGAEPARASGSESQDVPHLPVLLSQVVSSWDGVHLRVRSRSPLAPLGTAACEARSCYARVTDSQIVDSTDSPFACATVLC
jgi:hypothetical protein